MVDTLPDIPEKKPNYDVLATDAGVGLDPPIKEGKIKKEEDPKLQKKEIKEAVTQREAEEVALPKEEEVKVSDYKQFVEGDADNLLDDKEIVDDTIDREQIEPQQKEIDIKPPFEISPSILPFKNRLAQDGFDPETTGVITHPKEILEDPDFDFAGMPIRLTVGNGRITVIDRNTDKKLKSYIYLPPLSPVKHDVPISEPLSKFSPDTAKIIDQGGFNQEDLYENATQDRYYYMLTGFNTKYYKDKKYREEVITEQILKVMESKGQMPVADVARSYAQKFIKTSELRDQYLGYSLALQSYSKTGETHPDARFGDMLVELDSKDEVLNSIYQVSKATAKSLAWTADAILNIGTYPFRAVGALLTPEEGVGPVEHVWESLIGDPAGDIEPFKKITDKAYPEYGEVNSVFFGNAGELLDKKLDQPVGLTPLLHLGPSVKTAKPATSFAEGLKTAGEWASIDMIVGWGVATSAGKIVASRQAKIAEFVAGLKKKKFAPIKIQAELTKKGIGGTQQKGIINKAGRFYTQLGLGIMERPGVYALDSALFAGGAGYFTSLWSESTADFGDQIIEMPWGADIKVTRSDEGLKLLGEFSAGAIVGLGPRFAAFSVSKLFHYIGMTAFEHRLVSKKTMKELQKIGIMPKDPIASGQELQVYKNLGKALRDQYTDYEIKEMIKGMRWVGQVLNKIDPDNVLNTSALVGVYMRSNFLRDLRSRTLPENSTYLFKKFTAKTKIVEEMTTALRAEEFQLSKLFTEAIKNSGKTPDPDAAVRLLTKLQKQYNKNIADISEKASKSSKKTNSMIKEFHDSLSVGEKENISKTIIKVKKELGDKFKLTEETIHQFKDNAAIVKLGDKVADEKIGNTILRKGSTADDIDQIGIDFDKVSLRPEFERLKDVRKAAYDSIPGFNNLKLKVNARNFIETNETAIKNIVGKRTGMEGVEYHKLDTLIERRANTINKYILENVTEYKNLKGLI